MSNRQRRQLNLAHAHSPGRIHLTDMGGEHPENARGKLRPPRQKISQLPSRPDATFLSESIPLFFIGQNHNGFWVAREAKGRRGGIFLLKRSALRFARKTSEQPGSATMLLSQELELDLSNQGSRFVALLAAAMNFAERRPPTLMGIIGMAFAEWRKLVTELSCTFAGKRGNRAAIEKKLFRSQSTLASRNDDDPPVP